MQAGEVFAEKALQVEAFEQGQCVGVLDEVAVVFEDGEHRTADQALEIQAGARKRRDYAVNAFFENTENVGQDFAAVEDVLVDQEHVLAFRARFQGSVQARVLLEGDEDRFGTLAPDDLARDRACARAELDDYLRRAERHPPEQGVYAAPRIRHDGSDFVAGTAVFPEESQRLFQSNLLSEKLP